MTYSERIVDLRYTPDFMWLWMSYNLSLKSLEAEKACNQNKVFIALQNP